MDASVLMGLASAVMGMAGGGMGGGYDRGYGPRFDPYAGERYGAVSRRYDDAGFGYGSGPRRDYGRYGYDRGYGVRPQASGPLRRLRHHGVRNHARLMPGRRRVPGPILRLPGRLGAVRAGHRALSPCVSPAGAPTNDRRPPAESARAEGRRASVQPVTARCPSGRDELPGDIEEAEFLGGEPVEQVPGRGRGAHAAVWTRAPRAACCRCGSTAF